MRCTIKKYLKITPSAIIVTAAGLIIWPQMAAYLLGLWRVILMITLVILIASGIAWLITFSRMKQGKSTK